MTDVFPAEWVRRGRRIGSDREIQELREEALALCRRPDPDAAERWSPVIDADRVISWAWDGTARLAIALDDLDLAREIDPVGIRARACGHILRERGDYGALRQMIRMNDHIADPVLRGLAVEAVAETVNDRDLLANMAGQIDRVEDYSIRDRLLGRLGYQLKDPDFLKGIKSTEERIHAFSAVAVQTSRADLAAEALRLAMLEESPELLRGPSQAAFQLQDSRLFRRVLKVVGQIEEVEIRIVNLDLLGGCDFRNVPSRVSYHLIQSLPEYEPVIEDGIDWGTWEGTRVAPLTGMASRHRSADLARRVREGVFRNGVLSEIARQRDDLELTDEITDPDDRLSALIAIADHTGRLDVIDRALDEIRSSERSKGHLVDALATKIGILRKSMEQQLRLPLQP